VGKKRKIRNKEMKRQSKKEDKRERVVFKGGPQNVTKGNKFGTKDF